MNEAKRTKLQEQNEENLITQKEWDEYEDLRRSGVVNMMDATRVMSLTSLTRKQHEEIVSNYEEYKEEFGGGF